MQKIIIAIDGHSSTGKSTFAREIAAKLGYIYIDTGAMYRAVTLFAIGKGYMHDNNTIDTASLGRALNQVSITFKATGEKGRSETYLNGENVEQRIRSLSVSNKVSHIAAIPFVRNYVDMILHELGRNKGVVMDGRDIGTAVFPDAELKIFMTADPRIRAKRRQKEMSAKGEKANLEDVLRNIIERDYIDEHREVAPLVRANDAVLLDNSQMTVNQEIEWACKLIDERFNRR